MGSLDFVSPNATFAVSMALRSPQWMLGDVFKAISEQDPKFQQTSTISASRRVSVSAPRSAPRWAAK